MKQTRRELVRNCSKIVCVPIFSALPKVVLAEGQVPHFFIHCIFAGGMDPLYAFDARPLEMTDKGLFSNYAYKNLKDQKVLQDAKPIPVENADRPGTLRSPLTNPLMKFKDQFTVFNGLHFKSDVHELNVPSMYFGNSAGGDNFVSSIGAKLPGILDCVNLGTVGTLPSFGTNFGNSVALPRGNSIFGQSLINTKLPTTKLPSIQQIMSRIQTLTSSLVRAKLNRKVHQMKMKILTVAIQSTSRLMKQTTQAIHSTRIIPSTQTTSLTLISRTLLQLKTMALILTPPNLINRPNLHKYRCDKRFVTGILAMY